MTDESILQEAHKLDVGFSCRDCGTRDPSCFYPYIHRQCKQCQHAYQKQYRRRNAHHTITKDKKYTLKKRYGLSPEQFIAMADAQAWRCKICGLDPRTKEAWPPHHRVLHVDHDHRTGKIRGLLCNHCNRGVGFFNDNPTLTLKVVDYLEEQK